MRLEPGALCYKASKERPVLVSFAVRNSSEEAIVYQARDRHGHRFVIGGLQGEFDIFQPERQAEAHGFIFVQSDDAAIRSVDRRRKKRTGENIQICVGRNSMLANKREGFPEAFDHRGNQEIAAELYDVSGRRLLAEVERLLADGGE